MEYKRELIFGFGFTFVLGTVLALVWGGYFQIIGAVVGWIGGWELGHLIHFYQSRHQAQVSDLSDTASFHF